jgi:metal-responsive CopG/Arc/MetJ family transcriptional regulator
MKTSRTISISMPAKQLLEMERVAKREHRTLSELVRETFRQYQSRRQQATSEDLDLVMRLIADAKQNPLSDEDLRAENARLMAYGARQAKKAGIKERDIPSRIHASRSRRRAS